MTSAVGHIYTIGPATGEQMRAIPGIEQAAAAIFPEEDLPLEFRYRVTHPDDLRDALRDGLIWTATTEEGLPVGFAIANIVDGHAHLDEMDVLPDHARQGVGTRLVRAVASWAQAEGHELLTLITYRHLPWNAPFYMKLGFEPLSIDETGPEMRELLEEERLSGLNTSKRLAMGRAL